VEEQRWVVHVASSWMSPKDETEGRWVDATFCINVFYPYFVIFIVLGHRSILVFWMGL
jgi:hypothetical protein